MTGVKLSLHKTSDIRGLRNFISMQPDSELDMLFPHPKKEGYHDHPRIPSPMNSWFKYYHFLKLLPAAALVFIIPCGI